MLGHIPRVEQAATEDFFQPGFGMVAHAEEFFFQSDDITEDDIPRFVAMAKASDTWLTSTLVLDERILEQTSDPGTLLQNPGLPYVHPVALPAWFELNRYVGRNSPERIARQPGRALRSHASLQHGATSGAARDGRLSHGSKRRSRVALWPSSSALWRMLGLMPVVDFMLRTSRRRPGVRMETLWRRDFTDERIAALHAMACRLMAEDLAHFRVHAETNEVVHIFRRVDTGELVGFQFWRTAPMSLPGCRAILGGKLRILPEFRSRGLHLLSGLLFLVQNKTRHPLTRYYRLSIASLFGFVSITEALRDYHVLDPHDTSPEGKAVTATFAERAAESHYRMDPDTGLIFVDIFMKPETLADFGPSYFDRPAARRYAEINPNYRSNGCYVGFWCRFTPANLLSLTRAIGRKLWGTTAPRAP